jgi:nucleoside-diphosphate-sugar epimerase
VKGQKVNSQKVPKRVVVVGCNGFIGKALVNELARLGINYLGLPKEEFNLLDKATSDKLNKILNAEDQVVFTSAIAPSKVADDVIKSITMAETFCKSIEKLSVKQVILISSDSVYGDRSGVFTEESSCYPNSFHGLAQLSREIIFTSSTVKNLAILRVCAVYGPGDTHNGYGPNRFINQIKNLESIKIFGEGLNLRDHIFIDDVISLIIESLKINLFGKLNIVSGKSYSFLEVATMCKNIFSPNSTVDNLGSEGEIIEKYFKNDKVYDLFPKFVLHDLESGLNLWKSRLL